MKTARYFEPCSEGRIECVLCPRHCRIANGDAGVCRVREHQDGRLIATTYGRICGLAVDPIEKKPLARFLPGTQILSFGTAGCNLTCSFCQNAHLSRAYCTPGPETTPQQIADEAVRLGCPSVAFTYNEPTVFIEFAIDTAIACHKHGIRTVAVSNGWIEPEPRRDLFRHIDAANIDLKAFSDSFYRDLCGASLQPVLDTLVDLRHNTDVHLEVTTLLIPGWNDADEEIDAMTRWAMRELGTDIPWHFTPYRPVDAWRKAPPATFQMRLRAAAIARENGLIHVDPDPL